MSLPKLNPTLFKLRHEIIGAEIAGLTDTQVLSAIVWAIDAIENNWEIPDSGSLPGALAWILGELPYDTSE